MRSPGKAARRALFAATLQVFTTIVKGSLHRSVLFNAASIVQAETLANQPDGQSNGTVAGTTTTARAPWRPDQSSHASASGLRI
jgi:hypothetical protein